MGMAGEAEVTVGLAVATADEMRALGRRLAGLLRAGDLVLLSGELGAGKTTLARGLGEGLRVRGAVTSPTFVIARVHPPLGEGPALVHVDAYRLGGGLEEMDDLDLDVSLDASVVAVEWGEGRVEELTEDRLLVTIHRSTGESADPVSDPAAVGAADPLTGPADHDGPTGTGGLARAAAGARGGAGNEAAGETGTGAAADVRRVTLAGFGPRWQGVDLSFFATSEVRAG